MEGGGIATLRKVGRYTAFDYGGRTITFMHGKDLVRYLSVQEWDAGYLVVECEGAVKGVYEDYIDLSYILEKLCMRLSDYLRGAKEVLIGDRVGTSRARVPVRWVGDASIEATDCVIPTQRYDSYCLT